MMSSIDESAETIDLDNDQRKALEALAESDNPANKIAEALLETAE